MHDSRDDQPTQAEIDRPKILALNLQDPKWVYRALSEVKGLIEKDPQVVGDSRRYELLVLLAKVRDGYVLKLVADE